jgi:EmrB/QacA subfamily drug resistance transporter
MPALVRYSRVVTLSERAPKHWTVFAIVAVGVLMATIDASIVNVTLPVLARYFQLPLGGAVEWVVVGYLVVIAALLLTAGRLSDTFGRARSWAAGLAVFTVSSALCGSASSFLWLVGFRCLQGVGAAFVMAVSTAMLVAAFPAEQRGRALGLNALVVGLGISIGPTLGGVITQHFGWRWIFYVNVPLGVVGVASSITLLRHERRSTQGRIDWLGAGLLAIGLGGLTGTLSFGPSAGWASLPLLCGGSASLLALIGLCWHIFGSVAEPIVDPRLFGNRTFALSSLSLLLSFVATAAVPVLMPFYFQHLRGWSAGRAGLLLTPLPITVALLSPLSGSFADRIGTTGLAAAGMFIAATGLALLSLVDEGASVVRLVALLSMIGAGQAIFRPPNNSALMGAVARDRQGAAAGVLATARVVGQSLGIAGAGALFATFSGTSPGAGIARARSLQGAALAAEPFLRGMRSAFFGCTAIALAAGAAALVRGRHEE